MSPMPHTQLIPMSMCCRQDSDVDPNRAGAAHALPSGSCPAPNGYTHTHSKWGTSAGPSWVWAPSWLGQQYVCCSTAQRSPHERSAVRWLQHDACACFYSQNLCQQLHVGVIVGQVSRCIVIKRGLCSTIAPYLLCHADGACMFLTCMRRLCCCSQSCSSL